MRGTSFGRWLLLVPMVAVVAVMGGTGGVVPEMSRAHAGGPVAAAEPAAVSPNFVVVVTDDQRWDSIGRCSPTYDPFDYTSGASSCMPQVAQKLVTNGVTFLKGEVHQSLCCPSRASILTGQYSRHTGVVNLDGADFDDSSSLATWLDDAGYRTGLFGKYLNGYGAGPLANYIPPGWDAFHSFHGYSNKDNPYTDYPWIDWKEGTGQVVTRLRDADSTTEAACAAGNYYSTDLICRQALDWLGSDTNQPFFLYLAPIAPHNPNTTAGRHVGAFPGLTVTTYPSTNVVPTPNTPAYLPTRALSSGTMKRNNDSRVRQMRTSLAVDDMVGQVWDRLALDGRLANTVWILISDNGFASGEHRLGGKQCPYLECHRVPFVVVCPPAVCPGARAGVRDSSNYALNIDIAPTIADLAGVDPTLAVDGSSLVPIMQSANAPWRTKWLLYDNSVPVDGVVAKASDGVWYKYLVLADTGETQMFDLGSDAWETKNLWNDGTHGAIQTEMAAKLVDFLNDP